MRWFISLSKLIDKRLQFHILAKFHFLLLRETEKNSMLFLHCWYHKKNGYSYNMVFNYAGFQHLLHPSWWPNVVDTIKL